MPLSPKCFEFKIIFFATIITSYQWGVVFILVTPVFDQGRNTPETLFIFIR
ncbi:hypothetical protein L6255_02810 [Candidatus Parcubacteria bacterium]|nr:hypothetical protein [Candidatus Parcubacteria bacterium]